MGNNKLSRGKRYKFKMEKQGTGWSSEQRICNSAPHSPGMSRELVDVARLGDMTGLGNRNQPDSCWDLSSSFLFLGVWTVNLLRARRG